MVERKETVSIVFARPDGRSVFPYITLKKAHYPYNRNVVYWQTAEGQTQNYREFTDFNEASRFTNSLMKEIGGAWVVKHEYEN